MNEKKLLSGKIALITGAGKGIGRSVAKAFALAGASLAVLSRSADDLASLQKETGETPFLSRTGDVGDEAFVRRSVDDTIKTLSRIDVLVNNASVLTPRGPIMDVSTEDWDKTMRVNLRGPFLMMKYVLPHMVRQKSGVILNVSSGAGKRAAPDWGAYAVSKFGIEGLTRAAAEEVRHLGIRVNAVNPGAVRTRMRAAAYPEEEPMTLPHPDEIADLFVWLASERAVGISGESVDYKTWRDSRPDGLR